MNGTLLVVAFVNFALALFVYTRNRKKVINVAFAFFATSISLWIISNALFQIVSTASLAFFWAIFSYDAAILIASSLFYFSSIFPYVTASAKKSFINTRVISVGISLIWTIILVFYPKVILIDVHIVNERSLVTSNGLLFFALTVVILFTLSIINLFKKYKASFGIYKNQIKYLLLGLIISITFGSYFNLVMPLLGNYQFVVLGPNAAIILNVALAYSIIRHRLLDIRLVITRSLLYGLLVSLVALSFTFITFLSAQFFADTPSSKYIIAFGVALLIVFGLDPLKRLLSKITDRFFFQAKIDYQSLLKDLTESLSIELNLDTILALLKKRLTADLKIKQSAVLILSKEQGHELYKAHLTRDEHGNLLEVDRSSELVSFLREHQHASLLESLDRKIEDTPENKREPLLQSRQAFERLGAALIAPIFAKSQMNAILVLGPKLSGDTFSNDDLQLLEVLGPQIGSAIQKANLYEEVRKFSEGLKVQVDEATDELRSKNVSLVTLQHITKEITRTLDFNQVVQQIADSVSTELGYLGAILVFLDDDGYTVRARAITQTPLTQKALKVLPIKFSDYSSDLRDPKSTSLGHQALRSGEIMMTGNFSQVVSPPLPKLLAVTIQKLVGIKTMVIIPINSEGRTIGVIEIGVQRLQDEITKQELETMQSVADQLGVVSRNLKLFDQIRRANEQLEQANKHLQQLDQAKSEFVSIASHQLRTPMTGIMGYLSMMTSGDFGKIAPEHKKILFDLLSESQRMIRLINQFLNVSKIEAGKFTYAQNPVQLETLIEREVKEVAKAAKDKGLKLVMKIPKKKLPIVTADGDKLEDVILNLVDNAIKYTAQGTIAVGVEQLGDQVHFYVKDSGIGIKKEDAGELFNKFVRGTGIAQIHPDGSGLGLFIAKSIIDAHGGRIWAESNGEGKGSTFQFTIPITPAHPVALTTSPAETKPKPI